MATGALTDGVTKIAVEDAPAAEIADRTVAAHMAAPIAAATVVASPEVIAVVTTVAVPVAARRASSPQPPLVARRPTRIHRSPSSLR